jgi:hypothetical protein
VPPFDNALNGITLQRMMELLPGVRRAHGSCCLAANSRAATPAVQAVRRPETFTSPKYAAPCSRLVVEPLPFLHISCLLLQAIQGGLEGIRRLEQRHISVAEAKAASEVFLIGSSLPIMPVVQVGGVGWGGVGSGILAADVRH